MQFASPADRRRSRKPRHRAIVRSARGWFVFRHRVPPGIPEWWNAPVPAFGDPDAWLAIVGLAPGKHGANRTGRPFTGDFAGDLLYATLLKFGLAEGEYRADPADGLRLKGAVIVNAVKCLPPANKPEPVENRDVPELLRGCAGRASECSSPACPWPDRARRCSASARSSAHKHQVRTRRRSSAPDGRVLLSSYHCSRYNQNTGRLDRPMFETVFERAVSLSR